jgi:hypothetical protein
MALLDAMQLQPMPHAVAIISKSTNGTDRNWFIHTKTPTKETLFHQLVFALKYEGVNLLFLKRYFKKFQKRVMSLLQIEPTGQYSRKIWYNVVTSNRTSYC